VPSRHRVRRHLGVGSGDREGASGSRVRRRLGDHLRRQLQRPGDIPAYGQVTVTGQANYICTNPTAKVVPGQNPVAAQSGVSPLVQLATDKHGRATIPPITATVTAPPTPTAQQVGCGGTGNTQWTVTLSSLQATAAHLLVTQDGQQVYCRDYTLTGPSTGTAC
jgi:hypothetical protein